MAINNFRKADIVLDGANGYIFDEQFAKVYDNKGRDLVVQITNGGVIQDQGGLILTLAWKHDQAGNEGHTLFKILDGTQGLFSVTYDNAMLSAGTVTACIQITDNGRITNTRNFKLRVESNPLNVNKVVEQDSFTVFVEAMAGLSKYDGRISELEISKADRGQMAAELNQKADKDIINNQLSQMTSAPEYVGNYDSLLEKYPNGKVGMFVTADTNTKYIWEGGKWVNKGVYPTQGIADGGVTSRKLTPNTSVGILITASPVRYDPVKRNIRLPEGNVSISYQGDHFKWISQKEIANVGYGGFIVADVSGEKATLSYKEGAGLTENDVIVGGIFADNLNLNASTVASNAEIPASGSTGFVLAGSPIYLKDKSTVIFESDTSFINKNRYFVLPAFELKISASSGFMLANVVNRQVEFATGDKLQSDEYYNQDWFIFGGIMNGNLYVNGSYDLGDNSTDNKLMMYLGDSITVGFRTSDEATHNYPTEVNKINHVPFERYAVTGSTITAPQDGNAFVERSKTIDFSKATEVVIFGGHNDYKAGRPIGDIKSKDETTVLGALNVIVAKIYADNPKVKIKMISPNWRVVKENDPTSPEDNDIDIWKNGAGLMFKDYIDALNRFAKTNGFPILNLRDEWAVNRLNQKQWLVDGLHPNDAGQAFLGETVARFLN